MMASATLLVLAAGMGSRYGGVKQMDPVGPSGEVVIDYSVYDARRAGFDKVVFVIRRDIAEDFKRLIGSRFEDKLDVRYVYQELDCLPAGLLVPAGRTKPWGTAHAILVGAEAIDEPFAVINADDFYGADAFAVLGRALTDVVTESRYAMVGFALENTLSEHGTVSRGVCRTTGEGVLLDVAEFTRVGRTDGGIAHINDDDSLQPLGASALTSMNMWGFAPSFFGHLARQFSDFLVSSPDDPKAEFYIATAVNDVIERAAAEVHVIPTDSHWFGVTYQDDKPCVVASIQALVDAGVYPAHLWG